jgi:phytoene dehydrogenase-like protein
VAGVIVDGRELPAATVVSAVDPKTTFLRLMDPVHLTPDFMSKMRNYRASGTIAKVNLALAALPKFSGAESKEALSGRIHIGPDIDYLERAFDHAKYGELSGEPWLDVTIPSILDPALAPPGAHVMSVYVHYAPYRLRNAAWASLKNVLLERVMSTLEQFAPGVRAHVVAARMITPEELETDFGLWGGHPFHGELSLDQLFTMRPLLGYGRYDTPVPGLYLCGGGTHPGGFLTGANGKLAAQEIGSRISS